MTTRISIPTTRKYAGFLLIPDDASHDVYQYGIPGQEVLYNISPVPETTTLFTGALLLLPFGASSLRFLRRH